MTQAPQYRLGLLLVAASAVAWSSAGFFVRLIAVDSWTMLFWRGVFGALAGIAFVAVQERQGTWGAFRTMRRRAWLYCLLSSAGMIAYLTSMAYTTVAHVSIIYATLPFVASIGAWWLLQERPSHATLIASGVALAGVALTLVGGFGEGGVAGDALALLMTLETAAMIVLQRAAGRLNMVPAACLSAAITAAAAWPFASHAWPAAHTLLYLAVFGTTNMGFGLILFAIGSRLIPAAETALLGALDTPLAPAWVWLAFGETPRPTTILGGGVVLLAVLGHTLRQNRRAAYAANRPRSVG